MAAKKPTTTAKKPNKTKTGARNESVQGKGTGAKSQTKKENLAGVSKTGAKKLSGGSGKPSTTKNTTEKKTSTKSSQKSPLKGAAKPKGKV